MALNKPRHAWLTPNTEDALADLLCRRFFVPDSDAFRESVSGALLELTYPWNWEQYGTMTPDETALVMLEMYNRYALDSACDYNAPAPYWDDEDASDADDTELITTEDWYGGVTYTESGVPVFAGNRLENWIIAGFVAAVAGKDKAVRFLTATKQFDLYLKTGDWGGAVSIFLNGVLAILVDTYSASPGLKRVPVLTNGAPAMGMGSMDAPVELLIVQGDHHDGISTPQLQIVRKRLWAGEISPENTRYNSECDCVQITYDDGATWHDRPDADPRHSTIYLMPPLGGADPQCAAAGGMVTLTRQTVDAIIADVEIVQIANIFLGILLVLAGGAGILIDLILAVIDALLAVGSATISGAFDETAYAGLLCCFYCNIEADGSVTPDDLVAIEAQIGAELDTTVYDVMQILFSLWGEVLLSNAGVEFADTSADCGACDCAWIYYRDICEAVGDGITIHAGTQETNGVQMLPTSFEGWPSSAVLIWTFTVPTGSTVETIRAYLNAGNTNNNRIAIFNVDGTNVYNQTNPSSNYPTYTLGTPLTAGSHTVTFYWVWNANGGTGLIQGVGFTGQGDSPFGANVTSNPACWTP